MSRRSLATAGLCLLALADCRSPDATADLALERQGYQTRIIADTLQREGPAPTPPASLFRTVHFPSPVGQLVAYVSPDPGDGRKHPAVVWAHGGYGGIDNFFWARQKPDNDQSARAFREAGLVMMTPSWRGENDNPGRFEMFYGEVDDLIAARDYLATLPYVDANRIYLAGHSTGGTLTLLAAEKSAFRAAFSLGGVGELDRRLDGSTTSTPPPFDTHDARELRLRSPLHFLAGLKTPTYYFEGSQSWTGQEAPRLALAAKRVHAPLQVIVVQGATHFSVVLPITRLIAKKILADTGPTANVTITALEAQRAFVQDASP